MNSNNNMIELQMELPIEHEKKVFGQFDEHIKILERSLAVTLISRDGVLKIVGPASNAASAKECLTQLLELSRRGNDITTQNVNYAIWPEAVEQGKVAGANAAGEEVEYEQVPAALTFNGMNTALYAVGDTGKNPNLVYKTVEFKDMGRKQYKKYYFLNNRLCGVILIGDVAEMGKMGEAVEKRMAFGEIMKGSGVRGFGGQTGSSLRVHMPEGNAAVY